MDNKSISSLSISSTTNTRECQCSCHETCPSHASYKGSTCGPPSTFGAGASSSWYTPSHYSQAPENESSMRFLTGIILSVVLLIILYFTFDTCKMCVLGVFLVSSCSCSRFSLAQVAFWPSLIILLLNLHVLRDIHIKADVPVGETLDNFFTTTTTLGQQQAHSSQPLFPHASISASAQHQQNLIHHADNPTNPVDNYNIPLP